MKSNLIKNFAVGLATLAIGMVTLSSTNSVTHASEWGIPNWHTGLGPVTSITGPNGEIEQVFPNSYGIPNWHAGLGPVTSITGPNGEIIHVFPK